MEDDSIKLLKECSSGCKMAIKSIGQIYEYVKDEKLADLLNAYRDKHEKFDQEITELLNENGKEEEEPSAMAKVCSWFDIEVKMFMNADEHQIAKLMMDGCNMGIQKLSEYVNKYTGASDEYVKLAKRIIKAEEDFMTEMKQFV